MSYTISTTCGECKKKIMVNQNWFNQISLENLFRFKKLLHYQMGHKGLTPQGKRNLIKSFLLLLLQLPIDILIGTIKCITYPIYLIHEML